MSDEAHSREPDPVDVQVGLRLRALRKAQGTSQQGLGDALGITFQQIQKYERGTNRVSASMLVKAARAFGVSVAALLPEGDGAAPGSPAVLRLITHVRGAEELIQTYSRIKSPRLRRTVLMLARALASDLASDTSLKADD